MTGGAVDDSCKSLDYPWRHCGRGSALEFLQSFKENLQIPSVTLHESVFEARKLTNVHGAYFCYVRERLSQGFSAFPKLCAKRLRIRDGVVFLHNFA